MQGLQRAQRQRRPEEVRQPGHQARRGGPLDRKEERFPGLDLVLVQITPLFMSYLGGEAVDLRPDPVF